MKHCKNIKAWTIYLTRRYIYVYIYILKWIGPWSDLYFLKIYLFIYFILTYVCVSSLLLSENHSNFKHEWVQVSFPKPCAIYVLWWKQQAGNIHVCKNEIINRLKKYKCLREPIHLKLLFFIWTNSENFFLHFYIWGSLNKFPDFFRIGTFIDSTHMKL